MGRGAKTKAAVDVEEAAEWDSPRRQTMEGGEKNDGMTARQRRKKRGKEHGANIERDGGQGMPAASAGDGGAKV